MGFVTTAVEVHGLARQQVHLAQEARRAVPDDLAARRVLDRYLALEDHDEGIALIAHPEEVFPHLGRALLAQLGEGCDLDV